MNICVAHGEDIPPEPKESKNKKDYFHEFIR